MPNIDRSPSVLVGSVFAVRKDREPFHEVHARAFIKDCFVRGMNLFQKKRYDVSTNKEKFAASATEEDFTKFTQSGTKACSKRALHIVWRLIRLLPISDYRLDLQRNTNSKLNGQRASTCPLSR
jgi:hypothetical protein